MIKFLKKNNLLHIFSILYCFYFTIKNFKNFKAEYKINLFT